MLSFIVFLLAPVCQAPLAVFSPQTRACCISSPKSLDQRSLGSDRGQEQRYRHHEQTELHRRPPGTSLPAPSRRFLATKSPAAADTKRAALRALPGGKSGWGVGR